MAEIRAGEPVTDTVTIFRWEQNWREAAGPVRAILFGHLVQRTMKVTQNFLSDLYHHATWLDKHVNGPTEFFFMPHLNGVRIGDRAQELERTSTTEPRVLYHVALSCADDGAWSATFTELVRVTASKAPEQR